MLTADHVEARRKKGKLVLTAMSPERAERAERIATQLHDVACAHVDLTRAELLDAWSAVEVEARDRRLAEGLRKLVNDGLVFEASVNVDPVALRREVFERATAQKLSLAEEERFDAGALLSEIGQDHGLDPDQVERGLFADLKGAHVLCAVEAARPGALVESYDLEQARAVLLRAVRVRARVHGASPDALRVLFRKLKFQRLLYAVSREDDGGYRIDIDGPFSLFGPSTKYGLSLALVLPSIMVCGRWSIEADIRWGKKRDPMTFELSGTPRSGREEVPDRLRDDVSQLLDRFADREGPWTAAVADEILDLPGVGLCVPDLAFTHRDTGEIVLLEVMGFWSRDAVWKRVELVESGLRNKILFAVSSRLRVSEAVLPDDLPGALYVYKGTMSAKQIEAKLDGLIVR